jgi:transposase
MDQHERDRLEVLKKVKKKLIRQWQAAEELGLTVRQVKRLVRRLRKEGDAIVIHGLRGRESKRKRSASEREEIVRILSQEVYRGFGPTLASEYLADKHNVKIGRESLRRIMREAGLWRAQAQNVEKIHQWRQRRSCRGDLVQWDTSEHAWLEDRGPKIYLIHMIDDATSELTARFAPHDSTAENMGLLWSYLERHGRPVGYYTDKASLFRTAPKIARDQTEIPRDEREPLPPTQIGRALRELGIVWIAAHSPQAKGRVERSFGTAQDRLVKGLRVAGAKTLEEANRYLEEEFLPWWNRHLQVVPANATDAHRPLGAEHDLAASLSIVESRQVASDYTIRLNGKIFRIVRDQIRPGLRHNKVRVESRADGTVAVQFGEHYLAVERCEPAAKQVTPKATLTPRTGGRKPTRPGASIRAAIDQLFAKPGPAVWAASKIDRTRTTDRLD